MADLLSSRPARAAVIDDSDAERMRVRAK